MLFQSIELENFRQFVHEKIEFSTDPDKNVTLIKGENGTGKTTFAQAFFWCLYGTTSFVDKTVLSKGVEDLEHGYKRTVRVTIKLLKGDGVVYTIVRTQEYQWKTKRWEECPSEVNVYIKPKNGETRKCNASAVNSEIEDILPQALAGYFFFDGEKIDALGKE